MDPWLAAVTALAGTGLLLLLLPRLLGAGRAAPRTRPASSPGFGERFGLLLCGVGVGTALAVVLVVAGKLEVAFVPWLLAGPFAALHYRAEAHLLPALLWATPMLLAIAVHALWPRWWTLWPAFLAMALWLFFGFAWALFELTAGC